MSFVYDQNKQYSCKHKLHPFGRNVAIINFIFLIVKFLDWTWQASLVPQKTLEATLLQFRVLPSTEVSKVLALVIIVSLANLLDSSPPASTLLSLSAANSTTPVPDANGPDQIDPRLSSVPPQTSTQTAEESDESDEFFQRLFAMNNITPTPLPDIPDNIPIPAILDNVVPPTAASAPLQVTGEFPPIAASAPLPGKLLSPGQTDPWCRISCVYAALLGL